jgi:hypothetical protein
LFSVISHKVCLFSYSGAMEKRLVLVPRCWCAPRVVVKMAMPRSKSTLHSVASDALPTLMLSCQGISVQPMSPIQRADSLPRSVLCGVPILLMIYVCFAGRPIVVVCSLQSRG